MNVSVSKAVTEVTNLEGGTQTVRKRYRDGRCAFSGFNIRVNSVARVFTNHRENLVRIKLIPKHIKDVSESVRFDTE